MDIGISLPTMAAGVTGSLLKDWCRIVDEGPYSSISAGERITFVNPEMLVTLSAAAALTERVEVFGNLWVALLHQPAVLAKQIATLDVLSGGRLTVGLGVGGRPHDYEAANAPFRARHERLDAYVAELRALWSGMPPFEGADPVGPATVRPGGPMLLAGAMGPKAMARAATWADGVTGFALGDVGREARQMASLATSAWDAAGRGRPRLVSGTFVVLGVDHAQVTLEHFARTYLSVLGEDLAGAIASGCQVSTAANLVAAFDAAADAGCDEFIVVPGTWDLQCLEAISDVVTTYRAF